MPPQQADFRHLTLLIQRILDADTLGEEEGATLLTETEAARQHIERLTIVAESLVVANTLSRADGHGILETARRILGDDPGGNSGDDTGEPTQPLSG